MTIRFHLLSSVLLHHQDLDHPDEDVEEVELQRDTLVDGITAHNTGLGQARVVKHLLDIVQGEAAKDGETTVQPEVLSEGQSSDGSGGDEEGSKTRSSDDGSTGQERTTDVQVLLLLSSGADNSQTTHHGKGVETGTGEEGTGDEGEKRGDEGSLGGIESGPEGVLGDVVVRGDGSSANHGREAERKTTNADNPRVGHHQSVHEAGLDHLASRQANDSDSQTGVQEGVVQILALVDGHAAIFTGLAVEDGIDGDEGTAKDGAAHEQLAGGGRAGGGGLLLPRRLLVVRTGAGAAESVEGAARGGRRDARGEEARRRLGRGVQVSDGRGGSQGRLGELGQPLREARGPLADGERKRHGREQRCRGVRCVVARLTKETLVRGTRRRTADRVYYVQRIPRRRA